MKPVFTFHVHTIPGEPPVRVGHLVFEDRATRNSLRVESAGEMVALLHGVEKKCDVLLMSAAGPVFCSGGNLRDHVRQGSRGGRLANTKIAKALSKLEDLSIPTVVLIEGDVFGGGLEWISAFDFILAVPSALLGFWQRRMGLSFGWGGGDRLERRLGAARVKALGLEARVVSVDEARAIGLVDGVVSPWNAHDCGVQFSARVGGLSRASAEAIKKRRKKNERALFEKLWYGADHVARLERFLK